MIPLAVGAAVVAFYLPVAASTFCLAVSQDAAYIFLFLFTIVRVVDGALLIAAREVAGIYTATYILDSVGLSLLLLSTLGFLGLTRRNGGYSDNARLSRIFLTSRTAPVSWLLALVTATACCLTAMSTSQSQVNVGLRLREIGAILFAVVDGLLVVVHVAHLVYYFRIHRGDHRGRELLVAFTVPIPFLAVRVVYHVLSAYSVSKPQFARFNSITGDWKLFLGLSLIMEYVIVVFYNVCFLGVYLFYGSGM